MSILPPEGLPDRPMLRQLAGEKSFARGEEYFKEGRVRQLRPGSDRVSARVEGTHGYRVKLWQARGELQWSCTCPLGREAVFCKHAVATGLAWLGSMTNTDGKSSVQNARRQEEGRRELIHQHLATVDRERLVALLLEATDFDDILHRRLLLESIGVVTPGAKRGKHARTPPPDFSAYRQILREAIETSEYVDYDALPDYAQGVEEVIQPFGDLLQAGHGAAVVDLCEFALVELDRAAEMLDGGDGSLNRTYDALQYYHLEACRAAHPDPVGLAARLLGYELEGGLGVFNNAIKAYADVLGRRGQAEWRRLLTAQWNAAVNPASTEPAKRGSAKPIDHRRYQLQALMENFAEFEGDVDALIRIKERDLSSPHDFLSLAELCFAHARYDEAFSWAKQGLKKFPQWADSAGLRDLLVTELNRRGKYNEALKMVWADFTLVGNLENFRKLKAQVRHLPKQWPTWREKALTHLRGQIKQAQKDAKRTRWLKPPDHSAVVEILLDERDDEDAWVEAKTGGCNAGLALRLAARREKGHPEDALRIYHEQLGPTIARGGQTAYKEAVELLKKMRTVLTGLDRAGEFKTLRDEVRATHSRKRSFLKLLDAATA